ncbi:hypothetical protein [Pseudooceanicola nanhaiensis]|uniref:hypothetical protein n=1 Tax=Pseudooceanicola nanhaiensis TaxID=375761 RepID=UPI001CD6163E|nr:hypothetical protein [Pseudooceanicola nanhaiensis]MCA0921614.1 hypothetical protein [Pseudooceanicola nanhaiensis]
MINPISSIGAVLVPSFGSGDTSASSGQGSETSEDNKTIGNGTVDTATETAAGAGSAVVELVETAEETASTTQAAAEPEETAGTRYVAEEPEEAAYDVDRARDQAIATQKRMLEDMMAESMAKDPGSYTLNLKTDAKTGSSSYAAAAASGASSSQAGQGMDMSF